MAINYVKDGIIHYRRQCDSCLRKGRKLKPLPPSWVRSGYKKKPHCEQCGFLAKFHDQLNVFYIDGNLKNNDWVNLKTICLNCTVEIARAKLKWKASPPSQDL